MNRQIRRVAAVVLCAFVALLAAPFYWQVLAAERLTNDPRNARTLIKEYSIQRGKMVVSGEPVAESVPTPDKLKYKRVYPQGPRYGMVTGFYSLVFGRTLAEERFNSFLLGQAPEQFAQNLSDLLTANDTPGGTLTLTLDPAAQEAAERALGKSKGAVAAIDFRTGNVVAITTFPRYDPNDLSGHDPARIRSAWKRLNEDPDAPLLNRAAGGLYPPGSTFKVVTAAAALENGVTTSQQLPKRLTYVPPQTRRPINNFGGQPCRSAQPDTITLPEALTVSCNTAFAELGVKLGADKLVAEAEKFGLNAGLEYQLPAAVSMIPRELDPPATAQSAIGQRDVRVTPLQMASIAATIANGGKRMAPHVVSQVVANDGKVVKTFRPDSLGQVIPGDVAGALQQMMFSVVEEGTAPGAQIEGLRVGGKTGTAQNAPGKAPHAWFIGFTSRGEKSIAVAVIIENGGNAGNEATGGRVAAPVARAVMEAYLRSAQ
ncbi:MAG TPA: penicillin-binding transpeptidase domain-containing protein [Actinomycetes bacterium]|nr:penicillin-binding transpeptidase domain-containing protein [Actinomycetes bacterium]